MPDDAVRPPVAAHLEPDIVAAYVDGRLDRALREHVQAHLAECETCYELVSEVVHTQEALGEPTASEHPFVQAGSPDREVSNRVVVVPFARRRRVIVAAGSLLAAAAALLIVVQVQPEWWVRLRGGGTDSHVVRLAAVLSEARPIEGRLSGGFPYRPLEPQKRSLPTARGNFALLAVAAEFQEAADRTPTPDALHAWGIAQLLLHQFDGSIATLERAYAARSSDARYANDLAVARLARSSALGDRNDLTAALSAVEDSIREAPASSEPWFTKALILERLERREEALAAWDRYLLLDTTSPWRQEARQRRDRLKSS
jgi:tetratricopeptide (TPR) repeat protein